jgi:hypothetical protein
MKVRVTLDFYAIPGQTASRQRTQVGDGRSLRVTASERACRDVCQPCRPHTPPRGTQLDFVVPLHRRIGAVRTPSAARMYSRFAYSPTSSSTQQQQQQMASKSDAVRGKHVQPTLANELATKTIAILHPHLTSTPSLRGKHCN